MTRDEICSRSAAALATAIAGSSPCRVRDRGEEIQVTYRGRTIARLIPASRRTRGGKTGAAVWSDLDRLAVEIGARWPRGRSAVEAVREGRRRL